MRKKVFLSAGIFIGMLAVVATLVLAKPKPAPTSVAKEVAHVHVAVIPASSEVTALSVKAQGTVQPRREIDLVAQVSGQIVAVDERFVEGGFFDKSDLLVQIDDRDYKVAVLNAKAQVASAKQRVAEEEGLARQAKREWRDLGNKSANDLFMRKPQLAAVHANLASAEGALAKAELDLERTRVSVPFDGRVKALKADLGQFVSRGNVLATVYDSALVEVRLPLTEKQAALIDLPLTTKLDSPAPVTLRASVAGSEQTWVGTLTRTDAFIDAQSRMYYAVVEVHNPFNLVVEGAVNDPDTAPLLPGLFVDAEIAGKSLSDVMTLPRSALFERDKLVVLDEDNTARIKQIDVLHRSSDRVWVRSELADNALIAIEKQSLIVNGTQVSPVFADGTDGGATPRISSISKR